MRVIALAGCLVDQPGRAGRGLNPVHTTSVQGVTEPSQMRTQEGVPGFMARAFWLLEPGVGEIRPVGVREPDVGEVRVRTLRSAISRGTETLVFAGRVPEAQREAMRAPFQEGDFPGPVKYGYLNVGVVEHGHRSLRGRTVFCLHPHQTEYVVPASAVTVVPDDVPPAGPCSPARSRRRSTRSGTPGRCPVTASQWSAAGMVGCCVARLLARFPGVRRRAGRRRPVTRARGRGSGRRLRRAGPTPPRGATSSSTRAPPRPGCSSRSTCWRRRARSSS